MARESVARGGGPFAALVVRDGDVIGRGTNRVTRDLDPTAHAEVLAIREACRRIGSFRLEGCIVYASAEPCPLCAAALLWARPARVYYASPLERAAEAGFDDERVYRELARPPAERRPPMRRLEVPGWDEPFRAWEEKEDRVEY